MCLAWGLVKNVFHLLGLVEQTRPLLVGDHRHVGSLKRRGTEPTQHPRENRLRPDGYQTGVVASHLAIDDSTRGASPIDDLKDSAQAHQKHTTVLGVSQLALFQVEDLERIVAPDPTQPCT